MSAVQVFVAEPPAAYRIRPPLVVDSSIVCALIFDEPERAEALHRIEGRALLAPNLLDHEVVHVALKKQRNGRAPASSLSLALSDYAACEIRLHPTDIAAQCELAQHYGLSGYDAAYLWLAAEAKAPLATFDRRLADAAQKHFDSLR